MDQHVTTLFLEWLDQAPGARRSVDEHLRECPACADYFRKMSLLLAESGGELRRLVPDPHLPARIAARTARPSAYRAHAGTRSALRWSAAGALALLAVFIGISIGEDLAPQSDSYTTTDIVSAYYSAVSQQNFSTRLESVVATAQEDTP